jgi:hypothetical protein
MYSVPAREETYGILRTWNLKKTGRREEVLASKIVDLTLTLPICEKNDLPASINTL